MDESTAAWKIPRKKITNVIVPRLNFDPKKMTWKNVHSIKMKVSYELINKRRILTRTV